MNNIDQLTCNLKPINEDVIKVIQITDTHVLDDGAPSFNDFDTSASLIRVIQHIKTKEADADLILLTGDLVHEPTESAYQKLADHLSVITTPLFCLPGNHDDPVKMNYVMGANGFDISNLIHIGSWLIILLNTSVIGEHAGELNQQELDFLQQSLESYPECHCLIALHHHPVSINSSWMDAMALTNPDDLFEVVDKFDQVKGIIWGHIHQEFETNHNHIGLYGTPSTCLQFSPEASLFQVDNKPPAYRSLRLKTEGEILTDVNYLF